MESPLLDVRDLRTYFFTRRGVVKAVDGVSFSLAEGETLGLVGESGCGKSVTCLSLLRLVPQPAGRIVGGEILFNGKDILKEEGNYIKKIRGRMISMILQDPMTSLNPVFSVGDQVMEAIVAHQKLPRSVLWKKAAEMLKQVRIASPEQRLRSFPHQLSGGMKQRVVGAMALACQPHLLLADEPTTSLDVTVQAQYLHLLKEMQKQARLAIIFVTHDFGIVAHMCDRVAVMYAGRIVETAGVRELFNHPLHPYTLGLMESVPKLEVEVDKLPSIEGQPPSLLEIPTGCSFMPRCTHASESCGTPPPQVKIGDEHWVSCWKYA